MKYSTVSRPGIMTELMAAINRVDEKRLPALSEEELSWVSELHSHGWRLLPWGQGQHVVLRIDEAGNVIFCLQASTYLMTLELMDFYLTFSEKVSAEHEEAEAARLVDYMVMTNSRYEMPEATAYGLSHGDILSSWARRRTPSAREREINENSIRLLVGRIEPAVHIPGFKRCHVKRSLECFTENGKGFLVIRYLHLPYEDVHDGVWPGYYLPFHGICAPLLPESEGKATTVKYLQKLEVGCAERINAIRAESRRRIAAEKAKLHKTREALHLLQSV